MNRFFSLVGSKLGVLNLAVAPNEFTWIYFIFLNYDFLLLSLH